MLFSYAIVIIPNIASDVLIEKVFPFLNLLVELVILIL